jgi:hypothetical protein
LQKLNERLVGVGFVVTQPIHVRPSSKDIGSKNGAETSVCADMIVQPD